MPAVCPSAPAISRTVRPSANQAATVAFQNASLEAAYWSTYLQAGVAGLVGLVQYLLIAYGLQLTQRNNADRQRRTDLAEKRHEESMLALRQQGEALRTLIERTAQR